MDQLTFQVCDLAYELYKLNDWFPLFGKGKRHVRLFFVVCLCVCVFSLSLTFALFQ